MARIRSVHQGLFTDEAFVQLSDGAQVFLIGLGTEADDQGIFEWKPIRLRMRLRPTRDGDVENLLAEMEAVDLIKSYEIDGRKYGAIRNFRKHQKPKSPNSIHPITPEIRNYVALSYHNSEKDGGKADGFPPNGEMDGDKPNQFPPNGENGFQMEGSSKKERTKAKALDADSVAQPGLLPDTPAPQPAPKPPADKGLFGKPLDYLVETSGKSAADCRSLIGKWRKSHSDQVIMNAVTRAQVENAAQPFEFIIGCLNKKAREAEAPDRISYTNGSL